MSRSIARVLVLMAAILGVTAASASADSTGQPVALGSIPCDRGSDGVRFCAGQAGTSVPGGQTCLPGSFPAVGGQCLGAYDPQVPDTRVASFDGTPLDVNVTLPAAPAAGTDGRYPVVIVLHGYGGAKHGLNDREAAWIPSAHEWARLGYAVINMSDRGFGDSCGSAGSRQAAVATAAQTSNPAYGQACQQGWVKLMDFRYEVHDAQYLIGKLVDQGLADPARIGAVGESYGGGASLALASLKDRTMNTDGSVVPWVSPSKHIPLRIAAAVPTIPWSDLISSLLPNGRGLDYTIAPPSTPRTPAGVEKRSFVAGLYALGQTSGYYAPPGADPTADLNHWYAVINAGEPYDPNPDAQSIFDVFAKGKGSYYLLAGTAAPSEAPAPLLLSNGFTDDLFPVDETLRYYNLERSLYPRNPISLMYFDYGHQRGTNRKADTDRLYANSVAWINHYVRGDGSNPGQYVQALTQTCPASAPSAGPFTAASWEELHPGAVIYSSAAAQTVLSAGGDPTVAQAIDPVAGGGDACAHTPAADEANTANYRLPAATGAGFTLLGAPTITAQIDMQGTLPELAERLWDVAPDGTQTLVARGVYRPDAAGKVEVFQLHPGGWHFAAGHVPKLQLLGRDEPYVRASNGQFQLTISRLTLQLPTREGSGSGVVSPAPALPVPAGQRRAPGVRTRSSRAARRRAHRRTCAAAQHRRRGSRRRAAARGHRAARRRRVTHRRARTRACVHRSRHHRHHRRHRTRRHRRA